MANMDLRREPFRLLFPVGVLLGCAGVLPWLLFGTGRLHVWPGPYHALTMTQSFLVALAAGFLTTGREATASRRPVWVWAIALLTLLAAAARVGAERFGDHYVDALTVASILWLGGAAVWLLAVVPMLATPVADQPRP